MNRQSIVAGRFYPDSADTCLAEAQKLLKSAKTDCSQQRVIGAIAPHAGWICSGKVAAEAVNALTHSNKSETAVIFGSVHSPMNTLAAIFTGGNWQTPMGNVPIAGDLAEKIIAGCGDVIASAQPHSREHSIEVLVPILLAARENLKIVPIMVPPSAKSAQIGTAIGKILSELDELPLILGSTDFTHYGPNYGITPAGVGQQGIDWAMANDRRLLDIIEKMDAESVVAESSSRHNACGGGAIAATIAACKSCGAVQAKLLQHTNSYEQLKQFYPNDKSNSVSYCSIIFS